MLQFKKTLKLVLSFVFMLFLLLGLLNCELGTLSRKSEMLDVSFVIQDGVYSSGLATVQHASARFLTPDTASVMVSVYKDTIAPSSLQAKENFAVSLDESMVATARGSLSLPASVPLIIVAEIQGKTKDDTIGIISRAETRVVLSSIRNNAVKLTLLPTDAAIMDTLPFDQVMSTSITGLEPAKTRVIKFTLAAGYRGISVASSEIVRVQVRTAAGERIGSSPLLSPSGIFYALPSPATYYLILTNAGSHALMEGGLVINAHENIVPSQATLVLARSDGKVYLGTGSFGEWTEYYTGLSLVRDIIYANGQFIAVGAKEDSSVPRPAYSTSLDGINWDSQFLATVDTFSCIQVNPMGKLMALGINGMRIISYQAVNMDNFDGTGLDIGMEGITEAVHFGLHFAKPVWIETGVDTGYWVVAARQSLTDASIFKKNTAYSWGTLFETPPSYIPGSVVLGSLSSTLLAAQNFPEFSIHCKQLTDTGFTQATITPAVSDSAAWPLCFAARPGTSQVLLVANDSDGCKAYHSTDNGASWTSRLVLAEETASAACGYSGGFVIVMPYQYDEPGNESRAKVFTSSDGINFVHQPIAIKDVGSINIPFVGIACKE